MKAIHWIIAAAALAYAQPVQAVVGDPEVLIYRFPGVRDDGGNASGVGFATVFHCPNFSGSTETARFATRASDTTLKGNFPIDVPHLGTVTAVTHNPAAILVNLALNMGPFGGGTT